MASSSSHLWKLLWTAPKGFMNPVLATSIIFGFYLWIWISWIYSFVWSFKRLSPLGIQNKCFLREVTNVKVKWTGYIKFKKRNLYNVISIYKFRIEIRNMFYILEENFLLLLEYSLIQDLELLYSGNLPRKENLPRAAKYFNVWLLTQNSYPSFSVEVRPCKRVYLSFIYLNYFLQGQVGSGKCTRLWSLENQLPLNLKKTQKTQKQNQPSPKHPTKRRQSKKLDRKVVDPKYHNPISPPLPTEKPLQRTVDTISWNISVSRLKTRVTLIMFCLNWNLAEIWESFLRRQLRTLALCSTCSWQHLVPFRIKYQSTSDWAILSFAFTYRTGNMCLITFCLY